MTDTPTVDERPLLVAAVQTDLEWEQPLANQTKIASMIRDAELAEGTIVVLPEMFATGFSMNARRVSQPMTGPTVSWMRRLADELGVVLTGSLAIADGYSYFNRMLWVTPGTEDITYYDKRHLFSFAGEDEHYTAGQRRVVISYQGWRIMPLVCYDLRFPIWSRNQKDTDLLIYVANWPLPRVQAWQQLLPARAVENQVYVVGCNRVGSDGQQQLYTGQSAIYNMVGDTLAHAKDQQCVLRAELSKERLNYFRSLYPFLDDQERFMFS